MFTKSIPFFNFFQNTWIRKLFLPVFMKKNLVKSQFYDSKKCLCRNCSLRKIGHFVEGCLNTVMSTDNKLTRCSRSKAYLWINLWIMWKTQCLQPQLPDFPPVIPMANRELFQLFPPVLQVCNSITETETTPVFIPVFGKKVWVFWELVLPYPAAWKTAQKFLLKFSKGINRRRMEILVTTIFYTGGPPCREK